MGRKVGPYELERPLGKGAMGEVHVAVGPDGTRVALKLLTRFDGRSERRFSREFQVGRGLAHENLVRTLDSGVEGEVPWLAMELVQGRTLGALLKERKPFPLEAALDLVRQIAGVLAYLHARKIVHRDLKPDNVMVEPSGRVKVMDLGLIRSTDLTALTATGTVAGTPFYMAPENLEGKPASPASDLFSLAIVAYELLAAAHPFRAGSHPDLAAYYHRLAAGGPEPVGPRPHAAALDAFFARALSPRPEERPASAPELVAGLEAAGRGDAPEPTLAPTRPLPGPLPTPLGPARPGSPPAMGPGRGPLLWAATIVLLVVAIAWVARREPPVRLVEAQLLQGTDGRWAVAAVEPGIPLRLGGAGPVGVAGEGRVQAFALSPAAGTLELRTRGGALILAREADAPAFVPPPPPAAEYLPDGGLELAFPPTGRVALGLRDPEGREPAALPGAGGGAVFRLPRPGDGGFPPLGILARVGLGELPWGTLPARPPAEIAAGALVQRLAGLDAVALAAAADTDPDPARRVMAALEASRAAAELPGLARWIEARLGDDDAGEDGLGGLIEKLPKLRFLDALLHHLRAACPVSLEDLGLAEALAPVGYASGEPAPAPSLLLFPLDKDRFMSELAESKATIASPESLLAQRFGVRRLGSPPGPGPVWLDVHVRRVKTFAPRFYGLATVNGHGPFLFFENLRRREELRHGEAGGPWFNRRYRVRIPRRVLRPEGNEVELRFPAWTSRYRDSEDPEYQYENLHDAVCVQAVALRAGRES